MIQAAQRELKEKTEQLIQDKLQVEVRALWAYSKRHYICHMPHQCVMDVAHLSGVWRLPVV